MRTPEQLLRVEKTVVARGLRLERESFTPAASGEITLQGMVPDIEDTHGLLSRPLAATIYDSPAFKVYSAVYTDHVFLGSSFEALLNTIRPKNPRKRYDQTLGAWGTIGDWMISRERLIHDHQVDLEPYWSEFMYHHKELFITALRIHDPKRTESYFAWQIPQVIRRDLALQRFDEIVRKQLENEKDKPYSLIRSRLYDYRSLLKEFADQRGMSLGWEHYRSLDSDDTRTLIASLPAEVREKLVDQSFLPFCHFVINTERDPESEPNYNPDKSIGFQYLGNNREKLFYYDSWVELQLNPDGTIEEVGRYTDHQDKGLIPHFLWVVVKNTGQRLFLSSCVPEWISEDLDPRANTYLGLSVAKHLSGVNLPHREHLSTRYNPQFMLEAQTVMQNSWRRSQIVNDTDFFPNFEGFIETKLQRG